MNETDLLDLVRVSPHRHDEDVRTGRECKLCSSPAWHFDYVDFNKSCNDFPLGRSGILVEFFRCQRCELVFTDFCDYWASSDFEKFIYNDDYVKVDPEYLGVRPRHSAKELSPSFDGAQSARMLDYGSGSGMFASEMALRGFASVESYDPFSSPNRPHGKFDIVTCFDVIEHSPKPRDTFRDILSYVADDGCVLVGQTLHPYNIDTIRGDWWYIAPRNGHVTTYSTETMRLFAEENGLLFDDFGDLFALSWPQRSQLSATIIARRLPRAYRHTFLAPAPDTGAYHDWHGVEQEADGRSFRWSKTRDVTLGMRGFPAGECRIVIPFVMAASPSLLGRLTIRAGELECPVTLRNADLVATFQFAEAGTRLVTLRAPDVQSPAAAGNSSDTRPLGVAIWCEVPEAPAPAAALHVPAEPI